MATKLRSLLYFELVSPATETDADAGFGYARLLGRPVQCLRTGFAAPYLAPAETFVRRAKADNTLKGYRSDWNAFETFCRNHGRSSLPANSAPVAAYVAEAAAPPLLLSEESELAI